MAADQSTAAGGGSLQVRRPGISICSPVHGRGTLRPAAGTGARGLELIPDGQQNCLRMKEAEPLPKSGRGEHCQLRATTFLTGEAK